MFLQKERIPSANLSNLNTVVSDSGVYHQDRLVHQAEPFVFAFPLPWRLISQIGDY